MGTVVSSVCVLVAEDSVTWQDGTDIAMALGGVVPGYGKTNTRQ